MIFVIYLVIINTVLASSREVYQSRRVGYPSNTRGGKLITKLRSSGTYCFANSIIQCLNNIPEVKDYFSKVEIKRKNKEVVTAAFKKVFLDMNVEKELTLKNAVKTLSDCLESEDINFNRYSCPLEFLTSLLSQVYHEATDNKEYKDIDLFLMDGQRGNIEDFDYHPLKDLFAIKYSIFSQSDYLYTLAIRGNPIVKTRTSKLFNDYLVRKEHEGRLPKILILRTFFQKGRENLASSKELIIEDNISVQGINYKLSSWIVAPNRASSRHFYAVIRDEDNIFFKCDDTDIAFYDKKEVEDSVYLVFYERS